MGKSGLVSWRGNNHGQVALKQAWNDGCTHEMAGGNKTSCKAQEACEWRLIMIDACNQEDRCTFEIPDAYAWIRWEP